MNLVGNMDNAIPLWGKITIYGQMEINFLFGIGRPFPNDNIQIWKCNSISKNYNIIT